MPKPTNKPAGAACEHCPGRFAPCVPAEPADGRPRLVVVGESPGANEVSEGRPFVGASGRMMERVLQRMGGLKRSEVHWTNAILCDVPKREQGAARKACAKRLSEELRTAAAQGGDTVLAVGQHALHSAAALRRAPAVLRFRGSVLVPNDRLRLQRKVDDRPATWTVVPTVHPTFVMRAPQWEPIFLADVDRALRIARDGYKHPESKPGVRMVVATTVDEVRSYLSQLGSDVSIDIETSGLNIHTVAMTCLVISDDRTSVTIPISKAQSGEGLYFNGHHQEVISAINLCLATRTACTHNGPAFDHIGLARYGIKIRAWDDSLLAYHAITPHFPKRLGHVVACYIDAPPWKEWPHDVSLQELWSYCGRDGLYTAQAWRRLRVTMDDQDRRVYESDKRSAELCRDMSVNGFLFDRDRAHEISSALRQREAEISKQASELVGREINLLSPKQLQTAFFGDFGSRVLFRSDSGAPALNKEALRSYAAVRDIRVATLANLIIEARSVRKCRSTYVDNIKPHADGRVRPSWYSYGTDGGRWTSSGPNLANLPNAAKDPSAHLGGIRSLYIAPPGRKLCAFDVLQMEFRIAAYLSGDANMIKACQPGADVHLMNAYAIFGDAVDAADPAGRKALRSLAKTAGFAVCYMADAVTVHARLVSEGMPVSLQQVEGMLNRMKRSFATYYEYQAEALMRAVRTGYVESPILGRRRWVGHAPEAPKVANFPIQNGASDAMNAKLAKIDDLMRVRGLDSMLVAMVYDAAYFDVAERDADAMSAICEEVFAEPVTLPGGQFCLPLDLHVGERWSEL